MSKDTVQLHMRIIYTYFHSSWYWNSMRFIPKFCLIKTLCSLGNLRIDDEEAIGNMQIDANSKKSMHFISLIKQYQELALTACDASEFLGRRAEIT